eukprot:SAG31_NODE_24575_length_478_cov_1.614776_2_plen_80_part_01
MQAAIGILGLVQFAESATAKTESLLTWLRSLELSKPDHWAPSDESTQDRWDACGQLKVNCGAHGQCKNGVCVCDKDFSGK